MAGNQNLDLAIRITAQDSTGAALTRTRAGLESISRQLEVARRAFLSFQGALGLQAGVAGLVRLADEVQSVNARLRLATSGAQQFAIAQREAYRIAAQTGAGFASIATLYGRLAQAGRSLGLSQEQIARTTEVTALALRVSGASASEASSVVRQLAQAIGSGVLRGDEFNSIMENGSRLAKALADGLGLPVGKLRELAERGLLTSDVIALALTPQLERLRAEAASMPKTVGMAMSELGDSFGRAVDRLNQSSGATAGVASALSALARNIDSVIGGVAVVAMGALAAATARAAQAGMAFIANLRQKIAAEQSAAATAVAHARARVSYAQAELAAAQAAVASASGMARLTVVQTALVPAQQRLAAAQAALNAAMAASTGIAARVASVLGFLGGPLGALTTLLAMGATAWALWGNRAESAVRRADDALERLRRERRFGTGDAGVLREAIEELRAEERRLQQLAESPSILDVQTGQFVPDESAAINLARVREKLRALREELRRMEDERPEAAGAPSEAQRLLARKAWDAYIEQFRSKSEQLQAAVDELREKARDAGIAESSEKFQRALAAVREKIIGDLGAQRAAAQRAALDAELTVIREGLARAKEANDAALADRLIAIRDYYARKRAIEEREIDATIERTRQELAAQRQLARSAPQEADRLRARGEVAKLEAELTALNSRRASVEQANARAAAAAERELAEALAAAREELARLTGTETEAQRRAAIARQFADLRARLAAEGDAQGAALVERLIDVRAAAANLEALEARYRQTLERMRLDAELVRIQQEAGLLSEAAARERIIALQRQAADEAAALAPAMRQAAAAIGPEAELRVRALTVELERLRTTADEFAPLWQGIGAAFANAFEGMITRAATWRDALQALFADVAAAFRREIVLKPMQEWIAAQARMLAAKLGFARQEVAAEQAATAQKIALKQQEATATVTASAAQAGADAAKSQAGIPIAGPALAIAAMAAVFAAVIALLSRIQRFAAGGRVPGAGDRDTVPALLTPGEYVIRKQAVRRFGTAFLDAINGLKLPPPVIDGRLAFAAGGLVPASSAAPAARGPDIKIVNAVDPALARQWIESPAGERVIVNVIGRNAAAIRTVLGG